MSTNCDCRFKNINISDDFKSYTCSDLIELETPDEIWLGSNWKVYDESLRINPYVALHEVFRKNTSSLFLPESIPPRHNQKILEAIQQNSSNIPTGSLAFVTSGSTGAPKIVVHEKDTLVYSAKKILERFPQINKMRFHNMFPGNYMAGILNNGILPWLAQNEVYLDSVFDFRSPFEIAEKSKKMNTNFAWLSPNMISILNSSMRSNSKRKPNWDFVLSATGPLSQTQGVEFKDCGIDLQNTYGSTELLFISATVKIEGEISCGTPLEGVKIEIRNEDSTSEPFIGEIWANSDTSPVLELVYNPTENSYSRLEKKRGEFRNTNDIGYLEQNQLYLTSRSDDIVVLGGVNYSLAALENFADQYPGIVASCASAPYGGSFSDLTIYFETGTDSKFDLKSFQDYILNEFGVKESPRKFINIHLPRTHHGKIDKANLRGLSK